MLSRDCGDISNLLVYWTAVCLVGMDEALQEGDTDRGGRLSIVFSCTDRFRKP